MTLDETILTQTKNKKTIQFSTNKKQPLYVTLKLAKQVPVKATVHDADHDVSIYDVWHLNTPHLKTLQNKYNTQSPQTDEFYNTLKEQLQNKERSKQALRKIGVSFEGYLNGIMPITEKGKQIQAATISSLAYLSAKSSVQLLNQKYNEQRLDRADLVFGAAQLHHEIHHDLYDIYSLIQQDFLDTSKWPHGENLSDQQKNLILTGERLTSFYNEVVQRSTNYATTNFN